MKKPSSSLIDVTNILNDLNFHDGDSIGQSLGITRAAVWKVIQKLENYGVKINSVKGKGYSFDQRLILLEKDKIAAGLSDKDFHVEVFETIDSTNIYLRKYFGSTSAKICIAEIQTNGKGRLNRSWYSPFGKNIYLSCYYNFDKDISELAGLTLVVSLAVIAMIKDMKLGFQPMIKWPNDVIYNGQKIMGGLIEVQAESNGSSNAIIGLGLNVNMVEDDNHINQAWTSLGAITEQYFDRNLICASLINKLMKYLAKFNRDGLSAFMEEWKQVDYLYNKHVTIKNIDQEFSGICRGINQQGNIVVELNDGITRSFSSGDTSVRVIK